MDVACYLHALGEAGKTLADVVDLAVVPGAVLLRIGGTHFVFSTPQTLVPTVNNSTVKIKVTQTN